MAQNCMFFTCCLDALVVLMNTVHMNKFTLTIRPRLQAAFLAMKTFLNRAYCALRGRTYRPDPGPQWQQLELPFTRTPVRRWNR